MADRADRTAAPWRNPRLGTRIPELDGVRGLAILLVVFYHYIYQSLSPRPGSLISYLLASARLSWTGVDLFFVLSGFLIGGILYDAKDSIHYFRAFYLRRVCRIFPLYFLWIGLFVLLTASGAATAAQTTGIFASKQPLWPYLLFLQNFAFSARQDFGPLWLQMTWSLAIEEQFYSLLPAVVRRLSAQWIAGVAGGAVVLAPLFRALLVKSGNVWLGPNTLLASRADALGMGVLIALACRNEGAWQWLVTNRWVVRGAWAVAALGMIFLTFRGEYVAPFGFSAISLFYALFVTLAVVNPSRFLRRILDAPWLRQAGKVAYSVYIFHVGVLWLFHALVLGKNPRLDSGPGAAVTLLAGLTVALLAGLSWRFLEKPLIQWGHKAFRYD